jgi:cysteine desulfurase
MSDVYADHNATAPIRPEAAAAVAHALALGGNPSAVHADGRRIRALVEEARETVAAAIGVSARNLVFTSGGTEACNLMILGALEAGASRLLLSALEHDAVWAAAEEARRRGLPVETLPATPDGVIDLAALEQALAHGPRDTLVALMLAQNETGVIQPVAEASRLVRAAGGLLAVDAVQALGRIGVDLDRLGADYLAVSAHKIGGPPGMGALGLANGAPLAARQHGGGQELGRRSGTANAPGAAGFAAAVRALQAMPDHAARFEALIEGAGVIIGAKAPRLGQTTCVALPGARAETLVMALDLAGVRVSAGAACSSGKVAASRGLGAMGVAAELARGAVRFSFGWTTTADEIARAADAWLRLADRHSARARQMLEEPA